jgi:Ser/Thr protein kinase RdoA (MazF antagonist)
MSLLEQAPRFDLASAASLARDLYGLDASASALPSERDQNVLLTGAAGERHVLKIANASEPRAMLEAQNAAMARLECLAFCPRVVPTLAGDTITRAAGSAHLVRLVTYVAGTPLAESASRSPALLGSLGHAVGRLDTALEDFDHPAIHRDFHWDLANAPAAIREYLPLVRDEALRRLIGTVYDAAAGLDSSQFRRSAVHHDANDWNVLVDGDRVTGIIDFGDMVHSWTVADPAVAIAYAMLDAPDPLATAAAIAAGYHAAHPLRHEELAALFPLARLRLAMSACIAAWQQQQRPDDDYLAVSQQPIRRTLPVLAAISPRTAERSLRTACEQ